MIFYNIGINIPNFLHWIPNMKSVFWGQKKSQTRPNIFPWYFTIWDKHSQLFMLNFQHEISILGTKKNPKLDPKFSHDIYQHWDEHSQCMTSISQHPLWNCISQWNPKNLPSIPQHWETNSHDWVMNLGIFLKFPIRELVIFSCDVFCI